VRVSQRLDYTLRGMIALAASGDSAPMAAGEIAERLGLPRRFLEQQFSVLAKRGLLSCQRGAGGGCRLARSSDQITVGDIVRAIEGRVLDVPQVASSAASDLWAAVSDSLDAAVDRVTLAELAQRQRSIDESRTAMYFI
jgi:Rrf2 family protein